MQKSRGVSSPDFYLCQVGCGATWPLLLRGRGTFRGLLVATRLPSAPLEVGGGGLWLIDGACVHVGDWARVLQHGQKRHDDHRLERVARLSPPAPCGAPWRMVWAEHRN